MFNTYNQTALYPDNNPYSYFGENVNAPYVRGQTTHMPSPMPGNVTEDNLYPLQSSLATPQFNTTAPTPAYAKGGRVRTNRMSKLAEMIRRQGNNEDTILAHINPIEAMMLKQMGGSGDINPKTGLPQFSFLSNPWKATRASLGSIGGGLIGNMVMPGIGGIIGAGLGQGAQNVTRGKSFGQGALKGAAIGAMMPTAASLAGMGANSLGMTGVGNSLNAYGANNAIMPAISNMTGMSFGAPGEIAMGGAANSAMPEVALSNLTNNVPGAATQSASTAPPTTFLGKLGANTSNFLSQPANLLALGTAAGSFLGRKKEKSPERLAQEKKRFEKASRLTPAERAEREAELLATRQMERRIARNQYLPEERFEIEPMYRNVNSPEQYRKTGRWLTQSKEPVRMKKGGLFPRIEIEQIEISSPNKRGFLKGGTKGQDDKLEALLSDGEYIIPADIVSHLGDGNSNAGGKELDNFISKVRKQKGVKNDLPPKAKSIFSYLK